MKRLGRILGVSAAVIVLLAVAAAGFGVYTARRSFPPASGTIRVPGLRAEAQVYRDAYGVPHLYASNVHDLFLAQGYVHAQDRFYQMDFWRHQTAGRLSELYGEATLDVDRFLRTMGWRRLAEQEYARSDLASQEILEAYAQGVNAYLAGRSAAELSLEYAILGLTGLSGYTPEPWAPADTLAWGKAMAWDLGGNLDMEIARAILIPAIGLEKTDEYFPPAYPDAHPLILPASALSQLPLAPLRARLAALDELRGERQTGIGSNSWVIAGSRTTTGQPLLANDPHLGIRIPSIWYEIGLHCQPVNIECPYDVRGFSFAGVPAVIIGHNARIAWGFTNVGPDVQDLFVEKLNPANPNQYEVNGQWVDLTVTKETLQVLGGEPESLPIRSTRHGPIITDVYGLQDFAGQAALDAANQYALALRWTALEPNRLFQSVFELNRAQDFNEFRAALRNFAAPAQNIVYADVDGNIGYQMPGIIPIRASGDGRLPVPGWTDEHEWTGYIPFEQLPFAYNPTEGYIVTANNAVVGPEYPYLISLDWDKGYRARRIVDLIEAQPKISPEYVQQMQGDNLNLGAQEILPHLLKLTFDDARLSAASEQLRGWDYQMGLDSQPAALYMSFFNSLVAATFHDEVPEDYWPHGGSDTWQVLSRLVGEPDNAWWDDGGTPAVETRDDVLHRAFAEGYAALQARLGQDPGRWTWSRLHTATFVNETVGRSGISQIDGLFNRGPFEAAGGSSIVNATSFDLARDDGKEPGDAFGVTSLPSMRMIVDLGSLSNSLTVHTTGQSGHAYHPHYIDFAGPWRLIEYHPMLWDRAAIEAEVEGLLRLTP
ncbi:MAG: penicillin acylase family protein [Anaerolineales bacterium]|nr:penicillin acylase family protein [Anaerolineales bacterium]